MQEPAGLLALAAGADQRQPHPAERAARSPLEGGDDLVVAPLLQFVSAVVPDGDRPAAVLSGRDRPLERSVVHRVVLGLDRQVVAPVRVRHAARHRPADQHTVVFEAEVPVQCGRVVLLDDERRHLAMRRLAEGVRGDRLGCAPRGALGDVGRERARLGLPATGMEAEGLHRIADGPHALEDLVEQEVLEAGILDLRPGARGSDGRVRASAQGVGGDRRLGAVVLAPVDEHLAAALGLLHAAHDEVRMIGFDRAGQFVRQRGCRLCRLAGGQRRVQVDPLAAAGHRIRLQPMPVRIVRAQPATTAHSANPTPGPGSRSRTSRSAAPRPPSGAKRHCGTCSSRLATCAR